MCWSISDLLKKLTETISNMETLIKTVIIEAAEVEENVKQVRS